MSLYDKELPAKDVLDVTLTSCRAALRAREEFSLTFQMYLATFPPLEWGDFWQMQHHFVQDLLAPTEAQQKIRRYIGATVDARAGYKLFEYPAYGKWNGRVSYTERDAYRFVATYATLVSETLDECSERGINSSYIHFAMPLLSRRIRDQFVSHEIDEQDLWNSIGEHVAETLGDPNEPHRRSIARDRANFLRSEECTSEVFERLIDDAMEFFAASHYPENGEPQSWQADQAPSSNEEEDNPGEQDQEEETSR